MSRAFETVVGLEVHVQLRTRTKMFCSCPNLFGAPANTLTCPVCTGQPGALPVANRQAFTLGLRVSLALECRIPSLTRFDRKNYFYPDLPKGYQISQHALPIGREGRLHLASGKEVGIVRAHLEEDAGKTFHREGRSSSLVDLNRCGIPLLEIVSSPSLRSGSEAHEFLSELKLLLRHLEVSDCDMEKGSLRCDVNVSVRPGGQSTLGTRTEIKNLNSFKAVERAIEAEAGRQQGILASGGRVEQETRLWDDDTGLSRSLRKKEESEDYRYFPDPDLPPHHLSPAWLDEVRRSLPELPQARRRRYRATLGLPPDDAEVLIQDKAVASFFEAVAELTGDPKSAANWVTGDVFSLLKEHGQTISAGGLTAEGLGSLINLVKEGEVNIPSARRILAALYGRPRDPRELMGELGLGQISDPGVVEDLVRQALEALPEAAADLRAGKAKAAGALVGHVMRASGGRANPALVREILQRLL